MAGRFVLRGRAVAVAALVCVASVVRATPAAALFDNGSVIAPCDSPLYCHGDLLKSIELARPFADSKTFVDMPTIRPLDEVLAAFSSLPKPLVNDSVLHDFLATYFAPAGGELESVDRALLTTQPIFLDKLHDPVVRQFAQKVVDIWPDLTRRYTGSGTGAESAACAGCQSSFLPVNRTFVVAGGRFREPYYWDSYWILEGLLRTGGAFVPIARNTIENFLDLVERHGFVPNGARLYYLNRSQPPLLAQMVRLYIEHTGDTTLLARAVPLLLQEHAFWTTNRSVSLTASTTKTYNLSRYAVRNNQPRPESFLEDYVQANNASYYAANGSAYPAQPLTDAQQAALYAQLASGAESGWDYGTRWLARPNDAATGTTFPLRSINTNNIVPVDLNAILYWNEVTISAFLQQQGNHAAAAHYADAARCRSDAMYALMWNDTLFSYFDFNLSANAQNIYVPEDADTLPSERATAPAGTQVLFDTAQLYPFWTGAAPAHLKNDPLAVKLAFRRVEIYLDRYAGGIPATNLRTGQQWDEPNVWPPLQYVLMQGLLNTPPTFGVDDPDYRYLQTLALRLAQRYLDTTFCTWYATGGSTSETPQLAGFSPRDNGTIFEKYTFDSVNGAGSGGEYTVVEGFGWTNGILLWAVDTFGDHLARPHCGNITAAHITPGKHRRDAVPSQGGGPSERGGRPPSAVQLDPHDAAWTKMFGRRSRRDEGV